MAGRSGSLASRLHFYLRALGLTGLLALIFSVGLALIRQMFASWQEVPTTLKATVTGARQAGTFETVILWMMFIGGALTLLMLLVEVLLILRLSAGRRSAFGLNVGLQALLALAVVFGINFYSFNHYDQIDCTRDQRFTLPEDLVKQLRKIRGETTIVVLQQKSREESESAQRFQDYEREASLMVAEKVYDLVDRLRELGPRFKIEVLNAARPDFRANFARLEKEKPKLAQAIKSAPESSIFFYARAEDDTGKDDSRAHIQRLAFRDFYQLDRTASLAADKGKGNLVLLAKGARPFIRRILTVQERRPVIGVLVGHPAFTTAGREKSLAVGIRSFLEQQGFEVRDIILKSWTSGWQQWKPGGATVEEDRYRSLRRAMVSRSAEMKELQRAIEGTKGAIEMWRTSTLDQLTAKFKDQLRPGQKIDEETRMLNLRAVQVRMARLMATREIFQDDLNEIRRALGELPGKELEERLHIPDAATKLRQALKECDMLLLARSTHQEQGFYIPLFFHTLLPQQVEVIKEALKEGKPLLVSLGPTTSLPGHPPAGSNPLEAMLSDLGIRLDDTTILFEEEVASQRARENDFLESARQVSVPELDFRHSPRRLYERPGIQGPFPWEGHSLFQSLQVTERVLGKDLTLRLRNLRPVYYSPSEEQRERQQLPGVLGSAFAFGPEMPLATVAGLEAAKNKLADAVFLVTDEKSWKDTNPFRENPQPPEPKDPTSPLEKKSRSIEEIERGPFPVAVAVEAVIPRSWYAKASDYHYQRTRVIAIGSGTVFQGDLSPSESKLLLDCCNWLLEREDLLNREVPTWQFPRVGIIKTREDKLEWSLGAVLGIPLIFAFLGIMTWLRRKVR